MAQQNLDIIINAQDRTRDAFNNAEKGIDGFRGKLDKMQPTFQRMAVAGTVAFTAIAGVIYKTIEASNEAELVQAQLGAVLKSTGGIAGVTADQALKLADALRKQTTYGDEAILSAENLLLTFTSIKKDVFPDAIKTVLDMSTALGQDLKSSTIQLGKALQDPINGITALRRVGVNFSDDQQKVIENLVNTGKVMEAQKMILKELATEFGGSASAQAQTFAGKIMQLKEQFGELKESIGNALKPQLQALFDKIKPIVESIIDWIERNPELTAKILMFGAGLTGLGAIVGTLGVAMPLIISAFTILSGPVGIIIGLIALVVIYFDDLKRVFGQVWAFLEDTGVIQMFRDTWDQISTTFNTYLLPALKELWASLEPLKPFLQILAQILGVVLIASIVVVTKVLQLLANIFILIMTLITNIANFFVNQFKNAVDSVKNAIDALVSKVQALVQSLENLWNKAKQFGGNVLGGIGNTLGSIFKVNDAIITPQGRVIQPSSDDYIMATKNPAMLGGAGGVILNITGGNYLSENAAFEFGNIIIDKLRTELKI